MYNKIGKVAAEKLTTGELTRQLASVDGWMITNNAIEREFRLRDFEATWVRRLVVF